MRLVLVIDQREEGNAASVAFHEMLIAIPEAEGIGFYNTYSQRVGIATYEIGAVAEMLTAKDFGGADAKVANVDGKWVIVEVTPHLK